jgi:hypothetical protein
MNIRRYKAYCLLRHIFLCVSQIDPCIPDEGYEADSVEEQQDRVADTAQSFPPLPVHQNPSGLQILVGGNLVSGTWSFSHFEYFIGSAIVMCVQDHKRRGEHIQQ